MKYFSAFSGQGGFDLALNRCGHTCVGYSEIEYRWVTVFNKETQEEELVRRIAGLNAIRVYKKHFGTELRNYGDIREIRTKTLPEFDIFVGGFPCQSHSTAGKRGGLADPRGELFFEIPRILKDKRPGYFILENVGGLRSSDDGKAFPRILGSLAELGTYTIQWALVDSVHHGVPQNRERMFIVGSPRDEPRPEVFPLFGPATEGSGQVGSEVSYSIDANYAKGPSDYDLLEGHKRQTVVCGAFNKAAGNWAAGKEFANSVLDIAKALVIDDFNHSIREDGIVPAVRQTFGNSSPGNGAKILSMQGYFDNKKVVIRDRPGAIGSTNSDNRPLILGYSRDAQGKALNYHTKDKAGTVKAGAAGRSGNQSELVVSGTVTTAVGNRAGSSDEYLRACAKIGQASGIIRRFTPLEVERVMGYPDGWTEFGINEKGKTVKISDTRRYEMCGNAVVPSVVEAIARRLIL